MPDLAIVKVKFYTFCVNPFSAEQSGATLGRGATRGNLFKLASPISKRDAAYLFVTAACQRSKQH